jgi:hypothetical protein
MADQKHTVKMLRDEIKRIRGAVASHIPDRIMEDLTTAEAVDVMVKVLAGLQDQLIEDYGADHVRNHGVAETLRQLREDANTASAGLQEMRRKHYAVTQEREEARREVCKFFDDEYSKPVSETAQARGWGYLYPEEGEQ